MLQEIGTRGYDNNTGFNTRYIIDKSTLRTILDKIISGQNFGSMFEETSQYINSIYLFPFNIFKFTNFDKKAITPLNIKIGTLDTEVKGYPIGLDNSNTLQIFNYQILGYYYFRPKYNDFRDFKISYTINLPYYGEVELDVKNFYKRNMYVICSLDIETGTLAYYLAFSMSQFDSEEHSRADMATAFNSYNFTYTGARYTANVGYKISVGSNSASSLELNHSTQQISNIGKLVTSGLSIFGGLAVASIPGGGAMGLSIGMSGAKGVTDSTTSFINTSLKAQTNTLQKGEPATQGSSNFINDNLYIKISDIKYNENFDYANYRKLVGAPLLQNRVLSTLSGFTILSNFHLENIPATSSELDMLDSQLRSGIIL